MFEILDRPLVSFGCFSCGESSEIAPASSLRVFLARVQAILAGFQFTNHFAPHLSAFHAFDATSVRSGKVVTYSRRPVRLPDSYDLFSVWHPLTLRQVNYDQEGNVDMRVASLSTAQKSGELTGRINGDSDNWHLDQKEK
jgi:hypothetical protein